MAVPISAPDPLLKTNITVSMAKQLNPWKFLQPQTEKKQNLGWFELKKGKGSLSSIAKILIMHEHCKKKTHKTS